MHLNLPNLISYYLAMHDTYVTHRHHQIVFGLFSELFDLCLVIVA
jgi:hypothetical protein